MESTGMIGRGKRVPSSLRRLWQIGMMVLIAAALAWPSAARAVPVATATFVVDVQGTLDSNLVCIQGSYDNAPYDVFGTPVNFGTQVMGFTCTGGTGLPLHCESSPDNSLFNFESSGFVVLCDPPTCLGAVSFISDKLPTTGTVAQSLANDALTIDGTANYVDFEAASAIPNCPLTSIAHFTGQWAVNAFQPAPTAAGSDVSVSTTTTFFDSSTGTATPVNVGLTFSNVSTAGTTSVTASSNAAATLNANFSASYGGYQTTFLDITTTATFEGPVTVCTSYPDADNDGIIDGTTVPEGLLSFLHEEGDPLTFVDRTFSRDPVNNIICAQVESFSHLGLVVRTAGVCNAPGDPCDDGDACTTVDQCDGSLNCVGSGPPPDCDDGSACTADSCVSPGGCVHTAAPATGCLAAPKSLLKIARKTGKPEKDVFLFKWLNGDPMDQSQFGDPTSTDGYSLCVFDARGIAMTADVAPGGTCGSKDCWSALGTKGYGYSDKSGAQDGITTIKLIGNTQPKTKVLVKGKGANLSDAPLALVEPVTAQLIRDTPGLCFESSYGGTSIKKNMGTLFKGVTP